MGVKGVHIQLHGNERKHDWISSLKVLNTHIFWEDKQFGRFETCSTLEGKIYSQIPDIKVNLSYKENDCTTFNGIKVGQLPCDYLKSSHFQRDFIFLTSMQL